jgi:hypothetical protein
VQHDRSSPPQQIDSKHRVNFAIAFMSEVSPERRNAADFSDLLVFVCGSYLMDEIWLASLNGSIRSE